MTGGVITQYTVFVQIIDCDQDQKQCGLDTQILDMLNAQILIAFSGNANILSTEIIENKVVVILSLETAPDSVLETDRIQKDIEREIKDVEEFGDIDITL